jgi:hypothetical protein
MATNYLNNLNNIIKINSSMISNAESKDALVALSKRNSEDLNRIADYINSLLVPSVSGLCSKVRYPYDAVESGISGLTIVTYPEAQGNNKYNSELFWMAGPTEETGRPCTIKESFDYLLSNMIDRVVEVRESVADLNPLLEQVICSNNNIVKVATDSFGLKYVERLDCSTEGSLNYPLSEHIYQIIDQLTGSSVADDLTTGSSDYPTLSIAGVAAATELVKGTVEIATIREVVYARGLSDSDSNAELAVTPDRLNSALSSDDADGNLLPGEVNKIRITVKNIADEQIASSNIGALANVDESGVTPGSVLNYDGTNWVPGTASLNALLGTRDQESNITDVNNNSYMDHGTVVVYDHKEELNSKTNSYEVSGLNFNYYKSKDKDWTKVAGITISESLKNKGIPFVFKNAPKYDVFNTTYIAGINANPFFSQTLENIFDPSFAKAKEIGFYQNSCSIWDTVTGEHLMDPRTVVGVCRSDLKYGKNWIDSTTFESVLPEYETFVNSFNGFECIQESGTSKVMVIGPYELGDNIYLCPGKILDLAGIPNNIGIGISSTFLSASVNDLTLGAVNVNESLFELLYREKYQTCVDASTFVMVKAKTLGTIVGDITYGENKALSPINSLCYSLVESNYDNTATNNLISYFQTEILEIDNTALTHPEFIENIHNKVTVLSLPLVKLTI